MLIFLSTFLLCYILYEYLTNITNASSSQVTNLIIFPLDQYVFNIS